MQRDDSGERGSGRGNVDSMPRGGPEPADFEDESEASVAGAL